MLNYNKEYYVYEAIGNITFQHRFDFGEKSLLVSNFFPQVQLTMRVEQRLPYSKLAARLPLSHSARRMMRSRRAWRALEPL